MAGDHQLHPGLRPIIGITTSFAEISIEGEPLAIRYAPNVYADAVVRAGGLPVHLPILPNGRNHELLDLIDGIILSGGGDVDPAAYGARPQRGLVLVESDRDGAELELLHAATETRTPVLGICRGLQLINVSYGGTLVQHLEPDGKPDHHPQHVPDAQPVHAVVIEPGSQLADAVAETRIEVNSTHHQAVDAVPPALRVSARSLDGVVEGIELAEPDVWVVGVQWHPEAMEARDPVQRRLFRALIEAAGATT
jgi:putative glutamine amidotransferase